MGMPAMNARGRFLLKEPFAAKPDVIYEVTAIREFSDLYFQGVDVYKEFYQKVGLKNGVRLNGETFDFNKEVELFPSIVTLEGTDRTIIYVPTTYIISYPNMNEVTTYSRLIMSMDIGMLPDNLNLDAVLKEVGDLVSKRVGISTKPIITRAFTPTQPTPEEHNVLENTRLGNIRSIDNTFAEKERYKNENQLLQKQVKVLLSVLRENNLLDGIPVAEN